MRREDGQVECFQPEPPSGFKALKKQIRQTRLGIIAIGIKVLERHL